MKHSEVLTESLMQANNKISSLLFSGRALSSKTSVGGRMFPGKMAGEGIRERKRKKSIQWWG